MRRLLLLVVLPLLLLLGVPAAVHAQGAFNDVCNPENFKNLPAGTELPSTCHDNPSGTNEDPAATNPFTGKDGILFKAMRLIAVVTGITSVMMILVGGIKYITSAGDANSINSAKNTIFYALIGLVVALVSQGIIIFVIGQL